MALVTVNDVLAYSGFKYSDFTENGNVMTDGSFTEFLNQLIPKVTQMLHRYCNVYSFEKAAYTEYHSGRGAQNYDSEILDYNPEDTVYYLHQLYCDTLVVSEETSTKTSAQVWTARTLRTNLVAGDYEIYQENDVTRVQFWQNIPQHGTNNIKFAYNTGYVSTSPQLNDIKFQCLRAINNVLLTKKKIQEATSIRNYGVRDYSQMFDVFTESTVLDDKVKLGLEQYRRAIIPAQFAYD